MVRRDATRATLARVRIVSTRGVEVCARCAHARTPLRRLRGLLFRAPLEPGSGLLLEPCSSVHTWLMRRPIDVVFLRADGTILRIVRALPPWRGAARRGARSVLELPPGTCAGLGLTAGDRLLLVRDLESPARALTPTESSPCATRATWW